MMQYVGARYVPRFVGSYDPSQSYEALDVVDNGSGTSYIAKIPTPANTPLTNTTYWFLYGSTNGAIINLQQQINDITTKINFINPSSFTGTNGEKIQAAIDQCGTTGGTIVIIDDFVLDRDIDLSVYTGDYSIKFIGLGGSISIGGYKFYSSLAANRNYSGADFNNIIFKNISNIGFDGDTLIRCNFINCTFENTTGTIVKASDYIQQFVFDDCHILGDSSLVVNTGIIIDCLNILSIQLTNCRIENLKNAIVCTNSAHNLVLIGNTIESFTETCIEISGPIHATLIHGNYFEFIADNYCAIDISGMTSGAISIISNYFKAASGYSYIFSKLPTGNNKSILFASNSFPISGTKKYEVVGTSGMLRRFNEFCNEGGDESGNTQYLPLYRWNHNGCSTGENMTYTFNVAFGSNGHYGSVLNLLGNVSAASVVGAVLEDGTTLTTSHFELENQDMFFANPVCNDSTTRSLIANKIVRLQIQIN